MQQDSEVRPQGHTEAGGCRSREMPALGMGCVLSHRFSFFFNAQHTALTPAGGHSGFEGPLIEGKLPAGSYFHYLHHRYFECNYGGPEMPWDNWFGSFHDGSPEATERVRETKKRMNAK